MNQSKFALIAGAALLIGTTGTVHAAADTASKPLDQAIQSIDKNLAKDSDNKGLQNAKEHLAANQQRQETNDAKHADKNESAEKHEATEKAEHAAKPEKAEKTERAEKVEKVEKVERAEKVDRPEQIERPHVMTPSEASSRPDTHSAGHPSH